MSSTILFTVIIAYFLILLAVAWYTSRNANNDSFFIGNRNSNWMLVAFGMIGTSLSGVTFVSVPGGVGAKGFDYLQIVIGYFLGYFVVAFMLLPLYYRLNLTSIYHYLQQRLGIVSYKTGAFFFIVSRVLGATARLYLVINVLQVFILDQLHVPFAVTTFIILLMILVYTFKGGVKTIVFTDTLQTTCMLAGLVVCIFYIMHQLHSSFGESLDALQREGLTRVFNTDPASPGFFLKQVLGGAFITITMTGLDQEMMQKNISVKRLGDSQKNMMTFSVIMVLVNMLFLLLGGLLFLFAKANQVTGKPDDLFPSIALHYMPASVSLIFIIGLISALFPSADGALTALTSSFCIDILGIRRNPSLNEQQQKRIRLTTHLGFALVFFASVMIFKWIDDKSIIDVIIKMAGFTYGPLLGLFAFGMLTRRRIRDRYAALVCLAAAVVLVVVDVEGILKQLKIGAELIIYNGMLTFAGLYCISYKDHAVDRNDTSPR